MKSQTLFYLNCLVFQTNIVELEKTASIFTTTTPTDLTESKLNKKWKCKWGRQSSRICSDSYYNIYGWRWGYRVLGTSTPSICTLISCYVFVYLLWLPSYILSHLSALICLAVHDLKDIISLLLLMVHLIIIIIVIF